MPEAPIGTEDAEMGSMPPAEDPGMNAEMQGGDPGMEPMEDPAMDAPEGEMSAEPQTDGEDAGDKGKKEIQKKTGELSNLLNNYEGDGGDADEELKKYVGGMIDSALEKLDGSDEGEESSDAEEMPDEASEEMPMPMESVRMTKGQLKRLNEIFNAPNGDREKALNKKQRNGKRNTPFDAPKFK